MGLMKDQQKIVNYLTERIKLGEYSMNTRIPSEKQLAEQFNVTRSTVREALKILQFMGVLSSSQGSGYRVADDMSNALSSTMQIFLASLGYTYKSISEIREALELESVVLIQEHGASDKEIAYLEQLVYEMSKTDNITPIDIEFHKFIAKISGNPIIETVTNALSSISESYILIPWANLSVAEKQALIDVHSQIIQNLKKQDKVISENAISKHYTLADQILETHNKHLLMSSVPDTANMSLKKLIESGLTVEEILDLVSRIKDQD